MADTLVISTDPPEDTAVPPEGATGDEASATIPDTPPGEAPAEETPEAPDRPEWLPEKFQSPEEMAKAYSELETRLSQGDKKADPAPEETAQAVVDAGFDVAALQQDFRDNDGDFSEATYKSFEEKGISREVVQLYIEGQRALQSQQTQEMYSLVGGESEYQAMLEWAKSGLSAEDAQAFNSIMDSGDLAQMRLAVRSLRTAFTDAAGQEPRSTLTGDVQSLDGVKPFTSSDEIVAAMADPRYQANAAYRKEVEARLAKTEIWG